jgi:hypothetical protein
MFAALSSCELAQHGTSGPGSLPRALSAAYSPLANEETGHFWEQRGRGAMKPQEILYMINNIGYCTCTVLAS